MFKNNCDNFSSYLVLYLEIWSRIEGELVEICLVELYESIELVYNYC